jgi:hypothetical protein
MACNSIMASHERNTIQDSIIHYKKPKKIEKKLYDDVALYFMSY